MTDLLTLQNKLKRSPESYREEFLQQARHFLSNLQIFKNFQVFRAGQSVIQQSTIGTSKKEQPDTTQQSPLGFGIQQTRRIQEFCALIAFLSHTCPLYKEETSKLNICQELFALVSVNPETLDPLLRKTLVSSLILLQKKSLINRLDLYNVLFNIFKCNDRELRAMTFSHLVNDLFWLSKTSPSITLTTQLQNLIFAQMRNEHHNIALKAIHLLVELWKRNIWVSDRVVNQIASMIFTTNDKLISAALYFFLGDYDTAGQEEQQKREENLAKNKEISILKYSMKHMKKKMKKQREIERTRKAVAKAQKAMEDYDDEENTKDGKSANINPLLYIHDPQHFAERLFYKLKVSKETFQTRMLIMDVLSKAIGQHKLLLFNFYPFLQRYLQPHQRHVTVLLSYIIRASHNLVPPEVLAPVIKTIANGFVNDKSTPEVITVGINSIREICSRAPLVMTEELLHDLVEYKGHKNKGIMTATRSLLNIFRELNPMLLRRKDRGKDAAIRMAQMNGEDGEVDKKKFMTNLEYGGEYVHRDVIGADLLYEAGILKDQGNEDDSDEWDENYDPSSEIAHLLKDPNDSDDDDDEEGEQGEGDFNWDEWEVDGEGEDQLDPFEDDGMEGDAEGEMMDEMDFMKMFQEGMEGDEGEMDLDSMFEDEDQEEEMGDIDMEELEKMADEIDESNTKNAAKRKNAKKLAAEEIDEEAILSATKHQKTSSGKRASVKPTDGDDEEDDMKLVQIAGVEDAPAIPKASIRILTPADFKKIELLKQKKRSEGMRGNKQRTDMLLEDIEDQDQRIQQFKEQSYVDVDESELNSAKVRKMRLEKAERVKQMKEHKKLLKSGSIGNNNQNTVRSVTTEEKSKRKAYGMIKHSSKVKHKATMSFKQKLDKTVSHVKSLKNMRRNLRKKVSKAVRK